MIFALIEGTNLSRYRVCPNLKLKFLYIMKKKLNEIDLGMLVRSYILVISCKIKKKQHFFSTMLQSFEIFLIANEKGFSVSTEAIRRLLGVHFRSKTENLAGKFIPRLFNDR